MFVNQLIHHLRSTPVALLIAALATTLACKKDEAEYLELNEATDCVTVEVLEEGAEVGDDDDSAEEDANQAWTDLTCCGGGTVIGQAVINPESTAVGEERYAAVQIDRDAFEATGTSLSEVVRATVSFDPRDVGEGEAELEQDGLEETLWDGWLGNGELGGVPRTDELCFHLWGEEESEE